MEAYSKRRTADAVEMLGNLRPTEALLISQQDQRLEGSQQGAGNKGTVEEDKVLEAERISADMLEVGDIVKVPSGASPPADGTIVSDGEATFDESSLTGESKPVIKHRGDPVFVGTVNGARVVLVRIDIPSGNTM
jgi:P-type E1-E2 ATPase